MNILIALLAGALFSLGLIISGMTDPAVVLNFLDVAGNWDPRLALVMVGALAITTPGFYLAKSRDASLSGQPLQIPTRSDIDAPLMIGSAMFGVGWGLVGLCPGPAVVAISGGAITALGFFASMVAGMGLFRWYAAKTQG